MKTAAQIKHTIETNQAKEWGFKSIRDAENDGYNVTRTSVTTKEVMELLSISSLKVSVLFINWRNNNSGYYTSCADLDCFYFNII